MAISALLIIDSLYQLKTIPVTKQADMYAQDQEWLEMKA